MIESICFWISLIWFITLFIFAVVWENLDDKSVKSFKFALSPISARVLYISSSLDFSSLVISSFLEFNSSISPSNLSILVNLSSSSSSSFAWAAWDAGSTCFFEFKLKIDSLSVFNSFKISSKSAFCSNFSFNSSIFSWIDLFISASALFS